MYQITWWYPNQNNIQPQTKHTQVYSSWITTFWNILYDSLFWSKGFYSVLKFTALNILEIEKYLIHNLDNEKIKILSYFWSFNLYVTRINLLNKIYLSLHIYVTEQLFFKKLVMSELFKTLCL